MVKLPEFNGLGETTEENPRVRKPVSGRRSEAKRPESGRQQMDYTMADLHQVRLKLQKHLAVVSVRQELALRRNWTLRQEFLQLEAHMETTGWESIRKMEVTFYKT
ncbi:hypothetical protein DUI87_15527 [Hirundo rustica rustica]|uniref:Uncharacterized protein n=1 Tax=Hirundo rustica rustica TaxID=333673 RepID=A0A3M0K9P7_HIRRU|nr:hypothetical protein DUI87_15527 [Hirundo rustica rustica]